MFIFERSSHLPVPCAEAFAWHERPGAFARLLPPWESLIVKKAPASLHKGEVVETVVKFGPISLPFRFIHVGYKSGECFIDQQTKGPFSYWQHEHLFLPLDDKRSKIIDRITYALPMGPLGNTLRPWVEKRLDRLFTYRHRTLIQDLYLHAKYSQQRLKILVTGSSGFVGSALVPFLTSGGHTVLRLKRASKRAPVDVQPGMVRWDSEEGFLDLQELENLDAVVHLAGENLFAHRWNEAFKKVIWESRVNMTAALSQHLAALPRPPKVVVSASGVGFLGSHHGRSEVLDESAPRGEGFLAELCEAWEAATKPLGAVGVRVVHPRFGVIVSSSGGFLQKVLPLFQKGLGGHFGDGSQMLPWVSLADVLGLILMSLQEPALSGPLHVVSEETKTNAEFCQALANHLNRPCFLHTPAFLGRCVLGDVVDEVLLASQHVLPLKAKKFGYEFLHQHLDDALGHTLGV